MPRKQGKAIPEGNGPVPYHDKFGSGESTMADLYRMLKNNFDRKDKSLDRMSSHFDRRDKKLDELTEEMKATNQRLVGLQHEARQPRLATEADVKPVKKTRKRTEDVLQQIERGTGIALLRGSRMARRV